MNNCDNCNFKKAQIVNAAKEIKPNTTLLFFISDEYDIDAINNWFRFLQQCLPENNVAFIPANMVRGVEINEN